MKTIATVVLVLGVIVASLICLLLSTCAVSPGLNGGDRAEIAGCALVSLAIAVGGVMLIGKINRKV